MIGPRDSIGYLPEVPSGHILSGSHGHFDLARFHGFVLLAGGNELRSTSTNAAEFEVDLTACAYSFGGYVGWPRRRPPFRKEDVGPVGLPHEQAGTGFFQYCVIQQPTRLANGVEHGAKENVRIEKKRQR